MDCQLATTAARRRIGGSRRRRGSARRYAPLFSRWQRVRALLAVTLATGILLTLLMSWGKPRELASGEAVIVPALGRGQLPPEDSVTAAVHSFQHELCTPAGLRQLYRDVRRQLGPTPSGLPRVLAQSDAARDHAHLAERIRCTLISSAADAPHTVRLIVRDEDPALAALLVQELSGRLTERLNAAAEASLAQRELLRAELCEPAFAQRTADELESRGENSPGRPAPAQGAPLSPLSASPESEPTPTPKAEPVGGGPALHGPALIRPTADSEREDAEREDAERESPQISEPQRLEVSGIRLDDDPLVFERRVATEELGELLTTRRQLMERLTPLHPAVRELDARTADLQAQLAQLPQPNWDLQMASSVSEVATLQQPTELAEPRPLPGGALRLNQVEQIEPAPSEPVPSEEALAATAAAYRVRTQAAESGMWSGGAGLAWPWGVGLLAGAVVALSLGRLARTPVLPGPIPIMRIPQVAVSALGHDSDDEITATSSTWKLCQRARLARHAWLASELLLALLLITGCLLSLARPAMFRGWLTDPLANWAIFEGVILRLLGSS